MRLLAYIACAIILCLAQANAEVMYTSCYPAPRADIAAHKSLPFGTILRVTNPRNGRSTTVKIHDRGPFIRGRQLDISCTKARQLGFFRQGLAHLQVQVLYRP